MRISRKSLCAAFMPERAAALRKTRLSPRSQVQSRPTDLSIRLSASRLPGPMPCCRSIEPAFTLSSGSGA